MAATMGVIFCGIGKGIERAARWLMPVLLLILVLLKVGFEVYFWRKEASLPEDEPIELTEDELAKMHEQFPEPKVEVNGEVLTARKGVVIATGSKPAIPPIPGLSDIDYWTTHDVISAESLPG